MVIWSAQGNTGIVMGTLIYFLKPFVAAICLATAVFHSSTVLAEGNRLDQLMSDLAGADAVSAARLEREIQLEWAKSGSASADFLLKRGRDAVERGEFEAAIGHFTALVDHAPDFAEGRVARAGAYYLVGLLGPAVQDLEVALTLNPRHYEAIFGLGAIFEAIDKPTEAYAAYAQVKAIHPHHPDVTEAMQRLEPQAKGHEL